MKIIEPLNGPKKAHPRRGSEPNSPTIVVQQESPAVPTYHQQLSCNQYKFYISDEIGEPSQYHLMCQTLRSMSEEDQVTIYINSNGGRLDSTAQIIAAIKDCKANVVTVADGIVASAATLLFLAGDGYIVQPHCLFMIHNFSTGTFGKGHELEAAINADIRWFGQMATEFYANFLTKTEHKRMIKGEDYWFTADEVVERLSRRVDLMHKSMLEEQREATLEKFTNVKEELGQWLTEDQIKSMESIYQSLVEKMDDPDVLTKVEPIIRIDSGDSTNGAEID